MDLAVGDPEDGAQDPADASADWERRVAALWAAFDEYDGQDFVARIDELAVRLPADNAAAAFERACARDSTGRPDLAIPLYRRALSLGLHGVRRRRAVIQLSSSLRNTGCSAESVSLLTAEREAASDDLDDAVVTVLALALADVGREREAASLALEALSRHLVRYQRSMANYARLLLVGEPGS